MLKKSLRLRKLFLGFSWPPYRSRILYGAIAEEQSTPIYAIEK